MAPSRRRARRNLLKDVRSVVRDRARLRAIVDFPVNTAERKYLERVGFVKEEESGKTIYIWPSEIRYRP